MTREARSLLERALALPEADRSELAGALRSLDAELDSEVEEAWREEVRRRLADLDSGRVKSVPWSEVREQLYSKLGAARR